MCVCVCRINSPEKNDSINVETICAVPHHSLTVHQDSTKFDKNCRRDYLETTLYLKKKTIINTCSDNSFFFWCTLTSKQNALYDLMV